MLSYVRQFKVFSFKNETNTPIVGDNLYLYSETQLRFNVFG